ncbi:MAG: hypothetical protein KGL39_19670 [Patescibacteria group bacterium]|nr:hypothetical protein [Patescibacteria group bacterium]
MKLPDWLMKVIQNPWTLWLFKVVRDSGLAYYGSNTFAPTKAWAIGLGMAVASGVLHAGEAYLTQVQQGTNPQAPPKVPMWLILVGSLLLVSSVQAQEKQGWGINPQFSAPFMFGQNAQGTFVSVPSFGVGADIGWKDYLETNGEKSIKYSLGVVLNANLSQSQPTGPNSVLNGLLGLEGGYKGINLVFGNQILGDPLTGTGGSRWLVYIGYDVNALIGGWSLF